MIDLSYIEDEDVKQEFLKMRGELDTANKGLAEINDNLTKIVSNPKAAQAQVFLN